MAKKKNGIEHPTATRLEKPFTKTGFIEKLDAYIEDAERMYRQRVKTNEFNRWNNEVEALLRHALGDDSKQVFDFTNIHYSPLILGSGMGEDVFEEAFLSGLEFAISLLSSIRLEVSEYFPEETNCAEIMGEGMSRQVDNRKVFVVHGHNEALRIKVANVLSKLGLEPIVLRDEPNKGRTIIEKFEENADVGFAVILLTADDKGYDKTKPEEIADRARQNVILELGYFIGRYGRDRLMAICEPSVERPGDISGVVYTDATNEAYWVFELVKELKAAGYNVDANKLL